ncbi:MAG: hypothetical protein WAV76_02775 [Bacteroidota bacterium]
MKRILRVFERSLAIAIIVEFCLWLIRILFPTKMFIRDIYYYAYFPSHFVVRFLKLGSYDLMYIVVNIVIIMLLISPLVFKYHRK